jgi:hypothetical protein
VERLLSTLVALDTSLDNTVHKVFRFEVYICPLFTVADRYRPSPDIDIDDQFLVPAELKITQLTP